MFFFEVSKLIETQGKALSGKASDDELKAGVSIFDKYGYRNTLDSLAGGDVTKYEYVLNLSYNEIFVKLLLDKDAHTYREKFREIIRKKNEK